METAGRVICCIREVIKTTNFQYESQSINWRDIDLVGTSLTNLTSQVDKDLWQINSRQNRPAPNKSIAASGAGR